MADEASTAETIDRDTSARVPPPTASAATIDDESAHRTAAAHEVLHTAQIANVNTQEAEETDRPRAHHHHQHNASQPTALHPDSL